MNPLLFIGLALLLSYLLGSLPTGYLLGRWLRGIDIRDHGSGSTGATNVLRVIGKGPGLITFSVDVGKGVAAVLLVAWGFSQPWGGNIPPLWQSWVLLAAALMAILGHSKPLWLKFRGGKSVATGLGVLLALHWPTALATFGVFLMVLALTRIVSLGSILAAISLPLWFWLFAQAWPYIGFGLITAVIIVWRHQSNIQRLLAGTEPRLGQT